LASSALIQRSLVKISYARNGSTSGWRAHGHYLSRKGAQREGERGLGFNADREEAYLPDRFGAWQKAGDRRLWKIVISPEAGDRVDLRSHARQIVAKMEEDLGSKLEWAAIDHHDTSHPHVHIAVRGVDEDGRPLRLPREYVRSGIRARSQELLTQTLGHRPEHERRWARERVVEAPRVTEIDRALLARASPEGRISFEGPVPTHPRAQERRLQDLRRLGFLERLDLAERVSNGTWRLSAHLEPALRQLQLAGDIQKSLARSGSGITDHHAPMVLTRIRPGMEVRGRIAGTDLDEARDEPLLIIEGTDGKRHVIPQTAAIARARGAGRLLPGRIVTLRGRGFHRGTERIEYTEIAEHGRLRDLKRVETPSTPLDLEGLRSVRETGALPPEARADRGFFQQWRRAVRSRAAILERFGLIRSREPEHGSERERTYQIAEGAEHMVESRISERERRPMTFEELERARGKPLRMAKAEAGRIYRGELVAYAQGDGKTNWAVLDTGRHLTAVPTDRRELEIGQDVRARARMIQEAENREQRRITWTLDDMEHQRQRGRER
jgi:type IV secretory pathway VirD2 relaxase